MIESFTIELHHLERLGHDVFQIIVFRQHAFHTHPDEIVGMKRSLGGLGLEIGHIESGQHVLLCIFFGFEDLGEEEIVEQLIVFIAKVEEIE